jgi:hypothetical protein
MKKILQSLIYLSIAIVFFASCEKDEARDTYLGGTAPVFTASVKDSIGLNFNTENDKALTLSWSNPNFQFASGVSSQNVSYTLEIDTVGANFAGPNKRAVSISQDLSVTYTQKAFNILISDLKVKTGKVAQLEMRVIASLGSTATNLVSNKLTFKVLPYAPPPKVPVPVAGTLWVTGSAFASGWSNPLGAPYVTSQKFTKVSDTQYELTVDMLSSGNYKLIQENGVWGTQYKKLSGDAYAGTFEKKDADPGFDAPAVAGKYKIVVDFQAGTYTVTKQ